MIPIKKGGNNEMVELPPLEVYLSALNLIIQTLILNREIKKQRFSINTPGLTEKTLKEGKRF